MPAFEEIGKKFKTIILVALTAIAALIGFLFYGISPDFSAISKGDISTVGQTLEDAPTE